MKLSSLVAATIVQSKKVKAAYSAFANEVKQDVQSIEQAKAKLAAERADRADLEREIEQLRARAASGDWQDA
jgi:cell division protein FtsB